MKKNSSNLYAFAIQDQLSQGLTGQTPSIYISKDGGSFAAATNSATEFNASTAPGLYTITFTATECDCDVMIIQVYLPHGQDPAILDVVEMQSASGGATPEEIAQAVWGTTVKIVTIDSTQADTFATASSVANIATVAGAIKAKTDNLPSSPAAVGSEMALTSAAIAGVKDGLATITATDALAGGLDTLANYGDAHWTTAAGFATPSDIPTSDITAIKTKVDSLHNTDLSGVATALSVEKIHAGLFNWSLDEDVINAKNTSGTVIVSSTITRDSSGNITAMEEGND